jgi:ribosomal protein S18 acetylase RimI-like enzyme
MTKITYRNAAATDVHGMLDLWRQFWSPQPYEANLRSKIEKEPDLVIVAEADGAIVGTVIGGYDGWWAWVYRVAVHPHYQHKGIASRLLRTVQKRLAACGADASCAIVSPDNEAMGGLLTGLGYRQRPYAMWALSFERRPTPRVHAKERSSRRPKARRKRRNDERR